jgi:hypothetical protein
MALGEQDPDKALQFLSAQPADLQKQSRIAELSAALRTSADRKQAAAAASVLSATAAIHAPVAAEPIIPQAQATPAPPVIYPKQETKSSRGLLFAVLGVVILAAAGAAYWFLRPAPVGPLSALEINATPYAQVVSVTSDQGKVISLPAGDNWTPLRLDDLPLGKYTVGFKSADGSTLQQQCDVAQTLQVCTIELQPIDDNAIDQIIGGAK